MKLGQLDELFQLWNTNQANAKREISTKTDIAKIELMVDEKLNSVEKMHEIEVSIKVPVSEFY